MGSPQLFTVNFSIDYPVPLGNSYLYSLYSCLKHNIPRLLFLPEFRFSISKDRNLLKARVYDTNIGLLKPLPDKKLFINGKQLTLAYIGYKNIQPCDRLYSPIVIVKKKNVTFISESDFLSVCYKQLSTLSVKGTIVIVKEKGQSLRKSLPVKTTKNYGYSIIVSDLDSDESIRLQDRGLGGKQKMGGGWFEPL